MPYGAWRRGFIRRQVWQFATKRSTSLRMVGQMYLRDKLVCLIAARVSSDGSDSPHRRLTQTALTWCPEIRENQSRYPNPRYPRMGRMERG